MFRKKQFVQLILIFGIVLLSITAFGQEEGITDELQDGPGTIWNRILLGVFVVVAVFVFHGIAYLVRLFKKDRLQKTLMNKYVVFHMKNGHRYHGTMRIDMKGAEIVSEESRQRGQAPSYIFSKNELQTNIGAYIRYHDVMNEREKRERAWDHERLLNPPLSQRIVRRIRNMFVELGGAVQNAINMIGHGIKGATKPLQQQLERIDTAAAELGGESNTASELNQLQKQAEKGLMAEESYERIIERLVGTRVKFRIQTVKHADGEYMGLLKDYNEKYMSFMTVKDKDGHGFRDQWGYEIEYKHNIDAINRRDDRGLRTRMVENEGKYFLVFENNTAYSIQVGHIRLHDGSPPWGRNMEFKWHIEPLSVRRLRINPVSQHKIAPFDRVSIPEHRTPRNFKKINVEFRSFRDADVIFPRKGLCTIIESGEKRQIETFSITALTDAMLEKSETEEIAIEDSQGRPIHGMNLVHGYITNVNEDRLDVKSVDSSYSRRWEVEGAYTHFDNALRKNIPIHKKAIPYFSHKLAAQNEIVEQIRENKLQQEAFAMLTYPKKVKRQLRIPMMKKIIPSKAELRLPLKVMALTSNGTNVEYPILERFEYVNEHHMLYEPVDTLRNDRLAKMDILWIGNGEIYKGGYRLNIDSEHRIKNFVSQGGVVIVSGQDVKANYRQRRGAGWIPEPLTGIEYDEEDELLPTSQGRRARIFNKPNVLNTTPDTKEIPLVRLDDMWVDPLGKWNSLAKSTREDASALLTLPFQKGLYIVTSLKNDTERDAAINNKLMENLLFYSVKWLDNRKWKERFMLK